MLMQLNICNIQKVLEINRTLQYLMPDLQQNMYTHLIQHNCRYFI